MTGVFARLGGLLTLGGFKSEPINTYRHGNRDRSSYRRPNILARNRSSSYLRFLSPLFWLGSLSLAENVRLREQRVRFAQARIRARARTFFIGEKRDHYYRLATHVFETWLESKPNFQGRYLDCKQLLEPIPPDQFQYGLAMAHVKSGYSDLYKLLADLRALKEKNNQDAFTLENKIRAEANDCLTALPDLSSHNQTTVTNFYILDRVMRAIMGMSTLTIVATASVSVTAERNMEILWATLKALEGSNSLCLDGVEEIARSKEPTTLTRLKTDIERLRVLHKCEFTQLEANAAKFGTIVESIHDQIARIISEIEELNHLNGSCDYEKNLE